MLEFLVEFVYGVVVGICGVEVVVGVVAEIWLKLWPRILVGVVIENF